MEEGKRQITAGFGPELGFWYNFGTIFYDGRETSYKWVVSLFYTTAGPSESATLMQAVSLSFAGTTEAPGCTQEKKQEFDNI